MMINLKIQRFISSVKDIADNGLPQLVNQAVKKEHERLVEEGA